MQPSDATIEFTPAEREMIERRQRQAQAELARIAAADTLEEQQRLGTEAWARLIERPRAARRVEASRRRTPAPARPTRPGRVVVKRRARAARTTTPSRGDPDDDPDEPPGHPWRSWRDAWALTWAERQPVLWRFRAARCRLLEIREAIRLGVDR
jgi:hypothetical protein